MFSIGILGFLVWSHRVALPLCEVGVINVAICWNSLVLTSTLNSKNLVSYTQSAGIRYTSFSGLKSSSETICDTSRKFETFNKHSKNLISNERLTWFTGSTEGDGAILTTKGKARFVLTQKEKKEKKEQKEKKEKKEKKEGAILHHVKKVLGFGTVRQFEGYFRFIVAQPQSILLLVYIFNGNLVLPYRQKQLGEWIKALNCEGYLDLTLIPTLMKPKLKDAWLSGFTDAEGCVALI